MTLLRLILLFAIALQPAWALQAGGLVSSDGPSSLCCGEDCGCALSTACPCHEKPLRPAPVPLITPGPDRVVAKHLLGQNHKPLRYELEPIEHRHHEAAAPSNTHMVRPSDLGDHLSLLCLWLI